ncbi:hypothetical protein D9758_009643 [Tetrapyrgos nigripes]|uniref:DUF7726 domain-containing protein n=1 Tax=Tetrapyrgos nigripes TaxID=182062 RepID=A0A8H5CNR7_9AGAR|nr:hypothetical protein D9758_009643 [Tetrapyrgos nigripes]
MDTTRRSGTPLFKSQSPCPWSKEGVWKTILQAIGTTNSLLNHVKEGRSNDEAPSQKNDTKRKRHNKDENDASNASNPPAKKRAKPSSPKIPRTNESEEFTDLFSIHLDGDENDSVPVFNSCNVIRQKIHEHLSETGTSKAQFLRDIACAAYPNKTPTPKIQSKQLQDFLGYEGASAGNSNRVFYAAYVYFEKKRISEGKPKSAHREAMERQWPDGFFEEVF